MDFSPKPKLDMVLRYRACKLVQGRDSRSEFVNDERRYGLFGALIKSVFPHYERKRDVHTGPLLAVWFKHGQDVGGFEQDLTFLEMADKLEKFEYDRRSHD
jgi:hypothetical protein